MLNTPVNVRLFVLLQSLQLHVFVVWFCRYIDVAPADAYRFQVSSLTASGSLIRRQLWPHNL